MRACARSGCLVEIDLESCPRPSLFPSGAPGLPFSLVFWQGVSVVSLSETVESKKNEVELKGNRGEIEGSPSEIEVAST